MVHLWCTHVVCMLAKCSMYTACRCTLLPTCFACLHVCMLYVVCLHVVCCCLHFFMVAFCMIAFFLWLRVACLCVHMVAFGILAVTAGMGYRVFLVFNRLQISSFGFFRHFFLCCQSTNTPNMFPKIFFLSCFQIDETFVAGADVVGRLGCGDGSVHRHAVRREQVPALNRPCVGSTSALNRL